MDRRRAFGAAVILLSVAVAACVAPLPPSPPPPDRTPSNSPASVTTDPPSAPATAPATPPVVPTVPPDSTVRGLTCEAAPDLAFPAAALQGPGASEFAPDPAATALRTYLAQDGGLMPDNGWHRVVQTAHTAMFLARDTNPGDWAVVAFLANGPSWDLDLNGACTLRVAVPKGFGLATWELDPARPPNAADHVVTVLATETACASGKPPGDRMQPPTVVARPEVVVVTLTVRHRPGGQDCPGNPIVPVKVDLGQPLGDRRLVDGADPTVVLESGG